jgi:hypothetical protein
MILGKLLCFLRQYATRLWAAYVSTRFPAILYTGLQEQVSLYRFHANDMFLVSQVFPLREASLRLRLLSLHSWVLNHIINFACHSLPGYYVQDVT